MKPSQSRRNVPYASRAAALVLVGCFAAVPSVTSAATEEEWQAFRANVAEACTAAAEGLFETIEILVDPFGSQHYGLALIRGKARGADAQIAAMCVYDKETGTAEIGSELPDVVWTSDGLVGGP